VKCAERTGAGRADRALGLHVEDRGQLVCFALRTLVFPAKSKIDGEVATQLPVVLDEQSMKSAAKTAVLLAKHLRPGARLSGEECRQRWENNQPLGVRRQQRVILNLAEISAELNVVRAVHIGKDIVELIDVEESVVGEEIQRAKVHQTGNIESRAVQATFVQDQTGGSAISDTQLVDLAGIEDV